MQTADPSTSTELVASDPIFSEVERFALAGFLAGYSGLTREAYALDLRQFFTWCERRGLRLFSVKRADIEGFGRELEERGRARATVARRLCTITGFYRYAVEEELLDHSPAVHVRRPRIDYESHATALDRNELGAMLVAAGLWAGFRARPDLVVGAERSSDLRGTWCEYRGLGSRTRAPDAHSPPKGRKGRDRSACAPHGKGNRSDHR